MKIEVGSIVAITNERLKQLHPVKQCLVLEHDPNDMSGLDLILRDIFPDGTLGRPYCTRSDFIEVVDVSMSKTIRAKIERSSSVDSVPAVSAYEDPPRTQEEIDNHKTPVWIIDFKDETALYQWILRQSHPVIVFQKPADSPWDVLLEIYDDYR